MSRIVRVAAAFPRGVHKPYTLSEPDLWKAVDASLLEIEEIISEAGRAGCVAVAFPEFTLTIEEWLAGHEDRVLDVVSRSAEMLAAVASRGARANNIYVIYCTEAVERGGVYNTAFFVGRDGHPIGRHQKVHLPISELDREHGKEFPVFQTPELGGVGMSICYDMIFPETGRCLALNGADVVFQLSTGGAAFGEGDISRQAYRVRATENQFYLIVAWRGNRLIVAPSGKVLAEDTAQKRDARLVCAEFDPFSGRTTGDSIGKFVDIRSRLFRERQVKAYEVLTQPVPPCLAKLPSEMPTREEAIRIANGTFTIGKDRFAEAEKLLTEGKRAEAKRQFEELSRIYPRTWIYAASQDRLKKCM